MKHCHGLVIVVTEHCPSCDKMKKCLDSHGYIYKTNDGAGWCRSAPQLYYNGELLCLGFPGEKKLLAILELKDIQPTG